MAGPRSVVVRPESDHHRGCNTARTVRRDACLGALAGGGLAWDAPAGRGICVGRGCGAEDVAWILSARVPWLVEARSLALRSPCCCRSCVRVWGVRDYSPRTHRPWGPRGAPLRSPPTGLWHLAIL